MGRSEEGGVQEPRRTVVVDVAPLPGQETAVLPSRHARSDEPRECRRGRRARSVLGHKRRVPSRRSPTRVPPDLAPGDKCRGRGADRVDDPLVAGAAAEDGGGAFAYLTVVGRRSRAEEIEGGDQRAGAAEAALQSMVLAERLF